MTSKRKDFTQIALDVVKRATGETLAQSPEKTKAAPPKKVAAKKTTSKPRTAP